MRKSTIDNLRWICVLILFPYHIIMIYNSFGENFYIKGSDIKALTTFIVATWPWFMPFLFVVAGISAAYAMQKRTVGAYARERAAKLLVPLIAGILLLIPMQTYFAERFHNGYTGGYFEQYIMFFTKQTDLTGYTGGFTPGHLWFILYLFVISLLAIPFILLGKKLRQARRFSKFPEPLALGLFILPLLGALILNIGGKSLGEYFAYFMLGYFFLSSEHVQQRLVSRRAILLGIGLCCMAVVILGWYDVLRAPELVYESFSRFYAWVMILAIMGWGGKYLNGENKFTRYMSHASFSVYLFHQTAIVVAAYYIFKLTDSVPAQMALILPASVFLTFASYEICRRMSAMRFLFAIKKRIKEYE